MYLTKCCCCCSLKYGYFAYGILSMAARLTTFLSLLNASGTYISFITSQREPSPLYTQQTLSISSTWCLTSIVSLFFTLKGITQKRSILIYPYIVILVVELMLLVFSIILLSATFFSGTLFVAYYLIILPFLAAILGYELWCLISLYKHIKNKENNVKRSMHSVGDMASVKTV